MIFSGAYEGRFKRHFSDSVSVPEISDLNYPIFSFRMDEIRGALAAAEMERLPLRLELLRLNYEYIVERLSQIPEIKIRQAIAPGSILGDSLIFRLPDASIATVVRFAAALKAEGIDGRSLGAPTDPNIRCYWNWRFLFKGKGLDEIKALLPKTTKYLSEAIDIPLSPTLTTEDCDDLIKAVCQVVKHADGRGRAHEGITPAAGERARAVGDS